MIGFGASSKIDLVPWTFVLIFGMRPPQSRIVVHHLHAYSWGWFMDIPSINCYACSLVILVKSQCGSVQISKFPKERMIGQLSMFSSETWVLLVFVVHFIASLWAVFHRQNKGDTRTSPNYRYQNIPSVILGGATLIVRGLAVTARHHDLIMWFNYQRLHPRDMLNGRSSPRINKHS
jgi:heme/copper-type cytochrome/quinol oxidase subunit 2